MSSHEELVAAYREGMQLGCSVSSINPINGLDELQIRIHENTFKFAIISPRGDYRELL